MTAPITRIPIPSTNESLAPEFFTIDSDAPLFKQRTKDTHKGELGKVLIIGGSENMPGAPVLSALSALRSGAGIVVLCTLKGLPYKVEVLEAMLLPLPSFHGSFCKDSLGTLSPELPKFNAIVLGPGLGLSKETEEFLIAFFQLQKLPPLVIDADAITIISKLGIAPPSAAVWTPHPGEAARILGCSPEDIQRDRPTAARSLAAKTGAVMVLKGAGTIIYANSTGSVVNRGNEYLATPGSGDVLSGIIATLIAQGLTLREAAERGVIVHAHAGEKAFAARGGPIIARDIINNL